MFILRALNASGDEFFYTGRAGSGWVSPDRRDAFEFSTIEVARVKATRHNTFMGLHGLRFIAMAAKEENMPVSGSNVTLRLR